VRCPQIDKFSLTYLILTFSFSSMSWLFSQDTANKVLRNQLRTLMDVAALNSRVVMEMKPVQVIVGKKDGNNSTDGKEVFRSSRIKYSCPDSASKHFQFTTYATHSLLPILGASLILLRSCSPGPDPQRRCHRVGSVQILRVMHQGQHRHGDRGV
jgi:hypothetical protein